MGGVLQGLIGHISLAYLDDEIVFVLKRLEHAAGFCAVFDKIRWSQIKAVEVLTVRRIGTVPQSRHLGIRRIPRSRKVTCTC